MSFVTPHTPHTSLSQATYFTAAKLLCIATQASILMKASTSITLSYMCPVLVQVQVKV